MKKKLISLLLLPLIALSQAGHWAMDFDEDFAAAASSAWSPLSIADCKMWLDAADTATVLTTGTAVTNWLDKSTAGNHAVAPTEAARPTIKPAAQNGLDVIEFITGNYLITPFLNGNDITVFAVVLRVAGHGESSRGIMGAIGMSPARSVFGHREVGLAYLAAGDTFSIDQLYNWGGNTFTVFAGTHGSGAANIYRNGVLTGGFNYGGSPANATYTYYIGTHNASGSPGTGYSRMPKAEIIIYNRVLTDAERNRVVDYLMQKWGIP